MFFMDDGILEGKEIISLIGDSRRGLSYSVLENSGKLKDLDKKDLGEIITTLCRFGLIKKRHDLWYLSDNGKRAYEKLQRQYV